MATHLVMAALAGEAISDTEGEDVSHEECDEMATNGMNAGCDAAVSHKECDKKATNVMHAGCDAAVSHKECDLVTKTVRGGNKKNSPRFRM